METSALQLSADLGFLAGNGEMVQRIRSHNWSATPIGPVEGWPQSLRVALRIALTTQQPALIFWGADRVCLYNDAFAVSLSPEQHPATLGMRGEDAWVEIWQTVAPQLDHVLSGDLQGAENEPQQVPWLRGRQEVAWTCTFSPIDDPACLGGVGGVLVFATQTAHGGPDSVTNAREAVKANEARIRLMADQVPVMLWVTDARGRCVWLNARFHEYTGQVGDVVLPTGWLDVVHPDDHAHSTRNFIAANATRTPYRTEYRLRGKDGAYRWALDAASPNFDPDGTFLGFVGAVIDIDDRHLAEDRLRTSEARFRAAVDAIQGVLWTNSPDGRMLGPQPGWSALTGQGPDEYREFGWSAAVHPDDAGPTIEAWNAAVAANHPFVFEHRVRRSDGTWGNYAIRAIPVREVGEVVEWVGVHTDITQQRASEAALTDLNATLEQRIATQLRQCAEIEAALRQSQKLEAIGQLTSGLAHDFNNMLTVVISGLHILARNLESGNEKARRYLDASLDGATRAAGLVDRLMAFSRQQQLALSVTDINAAIEGMAEMLHQALDGRASLELDLDCSLPFTLTDVGLLESAILNLAVNARDAMPDGGTVRIKTKSVEIDPETASLNAITSGQYVQVSVHDTGLGMPPEIIEKAFNPFFTTKDIGKGTGLGLSQVHGFARQNGGNATINSTPGHGTVVRVFLPVR